MATRKRKTTKKRKSAKKEAPIEHELPGGFWRQIAAILMIALALFIVITCVGQGGTILNHVHQFFYQGLGFAAYFIPALLVYLAIKIFRSEDNRVAIPVYIASILMIVWIAGAAAIWKSGGIVGDWLNTLATNVLSQGVVIFIYIILIFITTAFILQLSPVTFVKGTKNFVKNGRRPASEEDSNQKGKKLGQLEIKVNSGLNATEATTTNSKLLHKAPAKASPAPVKEE